MTPYVFSNICVTKAAGLGYGRFGYLRFTFVPISRWRQTGEFPHPRPSRTIDNGGRYWRPLRSLGSLLEYRWYRMVAYHFSVGPFTVSYVRDREGYGPCGPVWPRDARKK